MKITRIRIKHFRSIESLEFFPHEMNAICGPNSSGKSNVLRALRIALRNELDSTKLAENVTSWSGPNTQCEIELEFDHPTSYLITEGFKAATPFVFKTRFRRSGTVKRSINGKDDKQRIDALLDSISVVHVPAIRDIDADGLQPFRNALLGTSRKHKRDNSLSTLNKDVRNSIAQRGKAMLAGAQNLARDWMKVDSLDVDTTSISIESLFLQAGIRVKKGTEDFELSKLGTGHQSAVVIKLYKSLGVANGKTFIYLFEEPDNHLHPSSVKIVADELKDCIKSSGNQVFLTTHSPYLLNQIEFKSVLPLRTLASGATEKYDIKLLRDDQSFRKDLGKFGLRPAEALLAKRCIVVEGHNDVNIVRALIELHTGCSPEMNDVIIVPAGGKQLLIELCDLLDEIGADWRGILDWDALQDTNQPLIRKNLTTEESEALVKALHLVQRNLFGAEVKTNRSKKIIQKMLEETAEKTVYRAEFSNSAIGKFLFQKNRASVAMQMKLKKAAHSKQPVIVNEELKKLRLFVWKGSIEDAAVPKKAEGLAENFLIESKKISRRIEGAQKRSTILSAVKKLAHEPEIASSLIFHLWQNGVYKRQEVGRMLSFVFD